MGADSLVSRARRKVGRLIGGFNFEQEFFSRLIAHSGNFSRTTWLGRPIWQNVLDLWTIQETIAEIKPALLIETGTNRGGSSLFFAHLFDLMGLPGRVVTVDVEKLCEFSHQRVTYLIGNSVGEPVLSEVRKAAAEAHGPVMVILDSDHSQEHVAAELEVYAPLATPGSYVLVQDGVIDVLPLFERFSAAEGGRPGPLPAILDYVAKHPQFEIDQERCNRYLITHHPSGWLRRKN